MLGQEKTFTASDYGDLIIQPEDSGFGTSVSLKGDLNGDGYADLVVAAPSPLITTYSSVDESGDGSSSVWIEASPGYLVVFAGGARQEAIKAGASPCVLLSGQDDELELVWPISSGGDADGDGVDELLVGTQIQPGKQTADAYRFDGVDL